MPQNNPKISIQGARVNNLKNINVEIPKNKFVVITGISGSGKSSLAFDTIYAESQRRYVESLSAYARQFLGPQDKPDVDSITGLSPAIAIDQKTGSRNPRSTVGTMTEIYDFLRLLFARIGHAHCPNCQTQITKQSKEQIIEKIIEFSKNKDILILSPLIKNKKGEHKKVLQEINKTDFDQIRLDNEFYSVQESLNMDLDKDKEHNLDIVIGSINNLSNSDTESNKKIDSLINTALDLSNGLVIVFDVQNNSLSGGKEILFSENLSCPQCNFVLPEIEPRLFSFNSPYGACSSCSGLGIKQEIDAELVIPNKKLTVAQGAIRAWVRAGARSLNGLLVKIQKSGGTNGFSINTPLKNFSKKQLDILLFGDKYFEGVIPNLKQKYLESGSEYIKSEIEKYMRATTCNKCNGRKLNPIALSVLVADKNISEVSKMTIEEAQEFFPSLSTLLTNQEKLIAHQITKEIFDRLKSLNNVGLGYLSLSRGAKTLSGGEAQRVRLATQINSGLSNIIYVLDEPSIGLHSKDIEHLIKTLKKLRDMENTVIVVEHDKQTILAADHLIDVGPGAGKYGGEILAQGTPDEVKKNKDSLTGQYLSGKKTVATRSKLFKINKIFNKFLIIKKASAFNLKNINVKIPLGKLVAITGVSGSGKSTLITEILAKALSRHFYHSKDLPGAHKEILGLENIDKVILIDQTPIGRTPRSDPATYTNVFTSIRELFTNTPEAKIKRFDPGHFSFNVVGGRCEQCKGDGLIKIEMNFLSDVFIKCSSCRGKRFKPEVLDIHYKNKNISDVLEMTVEEALEFFNNQQNIKSKLEILNDVGLGYIQLGQSATTLSGGEAQRVKLATELARRATGRTLYILDEPTTGLHFDDINKLLKVLHKLVNKGNSVLIIEHNLDVIKNVDWVIDLGPDGGNKGGEIVAHGTPPEVAENKKSWTGKYLQKVLN